MTVQTWHHGLVARWWAEFNEDGDDVDFFRGRVAASGEPVLDAGCGTGRVLVPLAEGGIDVDGSDAAADMLRWCERALTERKLHARLYHAPMHELEPSRTYQTVYICGAFGIGGTRGDDLTGLRRIKACLAPGGQLVMDHYLPNFGRRGWTSWIDAPDLPSRWSSREDRRTAADGTELAISARVLEFDPLEQTTTRELRARHYVDGELAAEETHPIRLNIYFKAEIELMLAAAGFGDIVVTGGLENRPPRPWQDERIVFTATA